MAQLVAIKEPWDFRLRAKILAEDMGLEEVSTGQTLKFQGGKAPSTFVPRVVPTFTIITVLLQVVRDDRDSSDSNDGCLLTKSLVLFCEDD